MRFKQDQRFTENIKHVSCLAFHELDIIIKENIYDAREGYDEALEIPRYIKTQNKMYVPAKSRLSGE